VFQSQGAITEKLRSFSMHDLTTIQGDEPVGQRPYQTLPETKKKTRASANESAGKYLSEIKNLCFVSKKQGRQKWGRTAVYLPYSEMERIGRGS